MRAFFCFFFLTWALCAQGTEPADFEKFRADYQLLVKEFVDAKDRTVTVDEKWLEDHEKAVFALVDLAIRLISVGQPALVRQEILNTDIAGLGKDLVFLKNRRDVERAVAGWSMEDVGALVSDVGTVLSQLRQIGLQFEFQPQQVGRSMYTLEILSGTLKDPEFSSRVCRFKVGCFENIEAAKNTVAGMFTEMKGWEEKAKAWQPSPSVEPPLPDPGSVKSKASVK